MLHTVLGILFLFWLGVYIYMQVKYVRWYTSPEAIRQREKDTYDAAHAYLRGKCCCGRDQIKD